MNIYWIITICICILLICFLISRKFLNKIQVCNIISVIAIVMIVINSFFQKDLRNFLITLCNTFIAGLSFGVLKRKKDE